MKRGESRKRVLAFVLKKIDEGDPPSVREVAAAMGFATTRSAQYHLAKLVEEGELIKRPVARGYRRPTRKDRPGGVLTNPAGGSVELSEEDFNAIHGSLFVREEALRKLGVLDFFPDVTSLLDRLRDCPSGSDL